MTVGADNGCNSVLSKVTDHFRRVRMKQGLTRIVQYHQCRGAGSFVYERLEYVKRHHALPPSVISHARQASRTFEVAHVGDVQLEHRRRAGRRPVKEICRQVDGDTGQPVKYHLPVEQQPADGLRRLTISAQRV